MKNLILLLVFLTLPLVGFSQTEKPVSTNNNELVVLKKVEEVAPRKARASRNAKYLKVNYKKSNDIISIKAYRKSLRDKVRRVKLC
ncbi:MULTISPECIES: hypothetical protein [unclassified Winogradskyella]|uniref:hypothetical protein n=1 Tax=unclassified Winogradskyella TaxID=2615021 RepID=UPI001207CD00|nr:MULTISPECIES: hypothetical protein [unclassified Winogradskyella]RZN80299.1 MAG: hypothetical protein EVB12_04260 [Winogradskyella sp.]